MKVTPELQHYILSEKLGESLQSQVYKAYHKSQPNHPLVLKLLTLSSDSEDQSRHLRQKIERLKVLHDNRSCTPLALEFDAGMQFIVQPWFAGLTLDTWVAGQELLLLADFFTIACTLIEAIQAVHEAGIIHGGIKPHNILVQPGTLGLRLIDFITPPRHSRYQPFHLRCRIRARHAGLYLPRTDWPHQPSRGFFDRPLFAGHRVL